MKNQFATFVLLLLLSLASYSKEPQVVFDVDSSFELTTDTATSLDSTPAPVVLESAFDIANDFYGKDLFDSAEVYYHIALNELGDNSAILYNLSSAVYRQHRLGEAILLLERAKIRNLKESDIDHNLNYLYTQTVDKVAPPQKGSVTSVLYGAHYYLSVRNQLIVLSVLGVVLLLLFALILFKKEIRSHAIYGAMVFAFLLVIVMSSVGYKVYHQKNDRFGIILEESIEAKNEPKGVTLIFTLHEGTKVQIIKSREGWSFIKLPSGSAGWIKDDALGVIE